MIVQVPEKVAALHSVGLYYYDSKAMATRIVLSRNQVSRTFTNEPKQG